MAMSIVIGVAIGLYLDSLLGTKPWMFLLFMIFGIAAGFSIVIKEVTKLGKEDSREKFEGGDKPPTRD
jgi:ATP synthase protein I